MSVHLMGFKGHSFPALNRDWCRAKLKSNRLAFYSLSLLVLMGALASGSGNAALARPQGEPLLLAAAGSAATMQAQGMAGYVLNAETGMNTVYTRKLNRELLDPGNTKVDDSPVIQYQGPPPQAPPQMLPMRPPRQNPTAP